MGKRGTKQKYIYLCVTRDRFELPVAVTDTLQEMADIMGVGKANVSHSILRGERLGVRSRYVRVPLETNEEGERDNA